MLDVLFDVSAMLLEVSDVVAASGLASARLARIPIASLGVPPQFFQVYDSSASSLRRVDQGTAPSDCDEHSLLDRECNFIGKFAFQDLLWIVVCGHLL